MHQSDRHANVPFQLVAITIIFPFKKNYKKKGRDGWGEVGRQNTGLTPLVVIHPLLKGPFPSQIKAYL